MTRPEVTIEFQPPVRYDAIVWPRFERTRGALSEAIERIRGIQTITSLSSSHRPRAVTADDGTVVANVFEDNRRNQVVHSVAIGREDRFSRETIRADVEATSNGIARMLSLSCQKSHCPVPVPLDRIGDSACVALMLNIFSDVLKAADTQHGVIVDEVPEELRHAAMGAALEHLGLQDRKRMPPTLYGPGVNIRATGLTGVSNPYLTIESDMSNAGTNMSNLPSIVRMAIDHDPYGETPLVARLSVQTIVAPIGDMDPVERMRMISAWRAHLERVKGERR